MPFENMNSEKRRYKMLVLDLDDTLLRDDYTISEKNRNMIFKTQELGVKVVLASGRPTPAMIRFANELDLGKYDSYIISYNGGVILEMKTNETLFQQSLTKEEIHDLHDFSLAHNVDIITYSEKGVVSERHSEYIDIELKITGLNHHKVPCFKTEINAPAVKCIMLENPEYLKSVESKLKESIPHLSVARSKPFFLEIMPQGIDKAKSISILAERLGIKQEEIIAVGNAGNDLTMIEYAGLGVWVDNVAPELRQKADVIVASNNNDGVAEVIEKFIINN